MNLRHGQYYETRCGLLAKVVSYNSAGGDYPFCVQVRNEDGRWQKYYYRADGCYLTERNESRLDLVKEIENVR